MLVLVIVTGIAPTLRLRPSFSGKDGGYLQEKFAIKAQNKDDLSSLPGFAMVARTYRLQLLAISHPI